MLRFMNIKFVYVMALNYFILFFQIREIHKSTLMAQLEYFDYTDQSMFLLKVKIEIGFH